MEQEKAEFENKEQGGNPFVQDIKEGEPVSEEEKAAETSEETNELLAKCKKLEEEFERQKSQYVRLAADFDNYRKRQEQEREALLKYGAEDTIKKILPVLDTIGRAEKSFQELDDAAKLKESFEALKKQFMESLEKIGVEKIDTIGKEFDPNVHEAVMQTPSNEHDNHSIIEELQSGYKLHDRVIRPAMVNVAVNE
ncbi:MAG: nucleotide exchange factor GrpE [Candidatus Gastranaerophilales bacterium]|nr:nucleotide exchange factor GrpE [Candidatus Gastranaerophilales bacterium]